MSFQGISTGTSINDGTGDSLSAGATKVNANFQEIYDALGNGTDLLTGNPNITVGFVTSTGASFSGDVSIGGTLTYEDVNNVDSVGVVTARNGIVISAGGIDVTGNSSYSDYLNVNSGLQITGVTTTTSGISTGIGTHRVNLNVVNSTVVIEVPGVGITTLTLT
tara:strand:+ start:76917 stop:77408 length:492 start_codon:yes stop_codon:yes gene_type:complete